MLPVVAGAKRTKREILIYSVILILFAAIAPIAAGIAGWTYGAIAAALGAIFMWLAVDVARMPADDREMRPARRLFTFSMLYLFLLFTVLLVEGGVGPWIHRVAT